jgi:hypothetical protein
MHVGGWFPDTLPRRIKYPSKMTFIFGQQTVGGSNSEVQQLKGKSRDPLLIVASISGALTLWNLIFGSI